MRFFLIAAAVMTFCASALARDPVTNDPRSIDPDFPPGVAEASIDSHGARMNGHIYLADGAGPHPTVVLLHGFPGNEKTSTLLRRSGGPDGMSSSSIIAAPGVLTACSAFQRRLRTWRRRLPFCATQKTKTFGSMRVVSLLSVIPWAGSWRFRAAPMTAR